MSAYQRVRNFMSLFEGKTPAERNKTIAALVLGAIAVLFLARMFFGSSGGTTRRPTVNNTQTARQPSGTATNNADANDLISNVNLRPVDFENVALRSVPEPSRNIFAYYVASLASSKGTGGTTPVVPLAPTPAPTPPPPLTLSGLAPVNVFARTGDFKLDVTGDKFTPATRVYLDGQELPTRVLGAQQLAATVPASLVVAPGARQVMVRTPDGQLYSNSATLNVAPPPTPPFAYIGLLGDKRYSDKAMLKPQGGNTDLLTVQRGDVVGGRFRVTSISERTVDFTDTQLNIKHTLPYVESRSSSSDPPSRYVAPPQPRPQPPADADGDDEP